MTFENGTTLPPPTDDRIRWFETNYRVRLPDDFIDALKAGYAGVPVCKKFQQGTRERMIERMLCLLEKPQTDGVNGWYDLTVVISQLDARLIDDEALLGMNVIPIAALFGGDYVCLDFRGNPGAPVIAVWDHERSDEFHPVLEPVAHSFKAFDRMLS